MTPKSLPPELSDRFTEGVLIGKGGFARVFKAKRRDGIPVAIKIPITLDASTGKSFIAEMQNWTKFSHPNIVKVYDFNIMPVAYFEMELCDSSFADLKKPVNPVEAAWLLFNVCDGLKYAHAKAIIHRDLKPQNILLKDGVPKISDWGLSKVVAESTTTTATAFTPYYAAPEQLTHKKKDWRTDVWQLGVILYELVTGVLPFNGDNMVEIMSSIATTDPKKPGDVVTDARKIEPVIMMCLQKDPNRRFQSVTALQTALARYLNVDYAQALKLSVTTKDFRKSALFCGDLVLVNLKIGDIRTAHKYLTDFVYYTEGDIKFEAHELAKQIQHRIELNLTEIPDELIQKAEFIVHKVNFGF